jgi:DNA-binding Lrp family transcriptional regulator
VLYVDKFACQVINAEQLLKTVPRSPLVCGNCQLNEESSELMFMIFLYFCSYVYKRLLLLNKRQPELRGEKRLVNQNTPKKLDPIDMQIIHELTENSRVSLRKLSSIIGITPNLLHERLTKLEHEGIILGYSAVVDQAKMGYTLTAIIMIQVECGHIMEVENEISKENNVLSAYAVTGEFDLIVFAKFRDNVSLNCYLKKLLTERFIKRTTTLVSFNAVKECIKVV